jgi:hypothetical protein
MGLRIISTTFYFNKTFYVVRRIHDLPMRRSVRPRSDFGYPFAAGLPYDLDSSRFQIQKLAVAYRPKSTKP